jgi:hypothetical protein
VTTQSAPNKQPKAIAARLLDILGSYGLVCLLLAALFVLTVQGTLYQVNHGLYDAKKLYFESWLIWSSVGGVSVPIFPGGVLCMALLAANLLVGGLLRLRVGTRTAGVLVIHLGIIFMLLASLVKLTGSEEGHLTLYEGDESDHFTSYHKWEVAVWPAGGEGPVAEFVIEDHLLTDLTDGATRSFSFPGVPFVLELSNFLPHCDPLPKGPAWEADSPVLDGFALLAREPLKETERHTAGMVGRVEVNGETSAAILWCFERYPWTVEAEGQTWAVSLRHARYAMPFSIRLDDFQKEEHPGISMAKSYRSFVYRVDESGAERILIEMNDPLREGGLVLFQSGWGPQNAGPRQRLFSTFSVVRNPSDKWPEYSMWIITLGMLMAFGRKLFSFVIKSTHKAAPLTGDAE